ncbi:MAG: ATP-binding protein, partial [Clostridiales bacterium]|nr:ATP-binding protein [Clostridiales bacterium]
ELNYYAADRYIQPGFTYRQAAEKALRAARIFVAACSRGEAMRGLYLEGALGSGKTFLAASIAGELVKRGIAARFIVVPEFLQQLRFSYQERDGNDYDEAAIMNEALDAPMLILDDLGAHNSSQWTISKIYTLLNYRLNSRLPCVITTNLKTAALAEELGQRAASRIQEMCDRYILSIDEDIRSRKGGGGWQE